MRLPQAVPNYDEYIYVEVLHVRRTTVGVLTCPQSRIRERIRIVVTEPSLDVRAIVPAPARRFCNLRALSLFHNLNVG